MEDARRGGKLEISLEVVLLWIFLAVVWAFFGGQGNHWYQSGDWGARNAIFRDLIYRDWPVIYEEYDKAMVYYIGYWLPAAALVKLIGIFVPSLMFPNSGIAFSIGNQFLWLWTATGLTIVFLLAATYVKPKEKGFLALIPMGLILFSGMDIVPVAYKVLVNHQAFPGFHLEWWETILGFQFSSLTTCLFWVFNQAVIPWIVMLCLMQEKSICNYVYLGVCALISGPLPFLGIFTYMVLNAIVLLVLRIRKKENRKGEVTGFFQETFSLTNILSLAVMPVIYLYYQTNGSVGNGNAAFGTTILGFVNVRHIGTCNIGLVAFFLLMDVGVFLILIAKYQWKDPFFYFTIVTSLISPFFSVGSATDFTMRYSIPTVLCVCMMCLKVLGNAEWRRGLLCKLLCIALTLGAFTPMTEFMRGYYRMLQSGEFANVCDDVKTFDQDISDYNFMAYDYEEKTFFRYLVD